MSDGPTLRRAVFLDRDGTLIQEREYLADPDGVKFFPGVLEALRLLAEEGFALVVVTNQSGIARGLYSRSDYEAVARRVSEELAREGLTLDATYFCPHHPQFTGPCDCRKPSTGMYRRAAADLGLDLSGSYYVGDRKKDVVPATILAGTGILVRTGYGREEEPALDADTPVADTLLQAARLILASG